jgi:tetratricopeptide (TPR) repeat protein
MIYIVLIVIIVVCFSVIFYLIGNKAKKLRLIAVETIPEEKQSEVKKRLLELRLQKRMINAGKNLVNLVVKIFGSLWLAVKGVYKFAKEKKKSGLFTRPAQEVRIKRELKPAGVAEDKLSEAENLIKKRKYDEAEEKYIEILKDEPKNVGVYMALGEIYVVRKEWPAAEETYRHIMRIDPNFLPAEKELAGLLELTKRWEDLKQLSQYIIKSGIEEAWVYVKLGLSYRRTGYPDVAEEYFERAVALEPKNELALDYLIEAAIINKNKQLALKAFNTLLGVSADVQKIQNYKDKIDIL